MATATAVVNSFPKDRDYRREAMQAAPTSFTPTSEYQPLSYLITKLLYSETCWFPATIVSCG